jgi:hypothetical protein
MMSGALDHLALERGRVDELRQDVRGAQVREHAQTGAQTEQALLRALSRGQGVPLVPADGREQHRVGGLARREGLGGEGHAGGVDGGAAHERLREVEVDVVLRAHLLEHLARGLHDLGADAVAGQQGDLVRFRGRRHRQRALGAHRGQARLLAGGAAEGRAGGRAEAEGDGRGSGHHGVIDRSLCVRRRAAIGADARSEDVFRFLVDELKICTVAFFVTAFV